MGSPDDDTITEDLIIEKTLPEPLMPGSPLQGSFLAPNIQSSQIGKRFTCAPPAMGVRRPGSGPINPLNNCQKCLETHKYESMDCALHHLRIEHFRPSDGVDKIKHWVAITDMSVQDTSWLASVKVMTR